MTSSQIITLTTDFGLRDGFVAAMKGVILSICPNATLVDITHEVPPHDIPHAAYVLGSIYRYFQHGTIHVAVVDPGVGSSRYPLLLATPKGLFIGPDNGIFSYVLLADVDGALHFDASQELMSPMKTQVPEGCEAFIINRSEYLLENVSNTFHGRDVFAPVAAHIAAGVDINSVGQPINEVTVLNIPQALRREGSILGHVIFVDHFGNLITNIGSEDITEKGIEIRIEGRVIHGLSKSYSDATSDLLAVVGSNGSLEIAVRNGSAASYLNSGFLTPLEVRFL